MNKKQINTHMNQGWIIQRDLVGGGGGGERVALLSIGSRYL